MIGISYFFIFNFESTALCWPFLAILAILAMFTSTAKPQAKMLHYSCYVNAGWFWVFWHIFNRFMKIYGNIWLILVLVILHIWLNQILMVKIKYIRKLFNSKRFYSTTKKWFQNWFSTTWFVKSGFLGIDRPESN